MAQSRPTRITISHVSALFAQQCETELHLSQTITTAESDGQFRSVRAAGHVDSSDGHRRQISAPRCTIMLFEQRVQGNPVRSVVLSAKVINVPRICGLRPCPRGAPTGTCRLKEASCGFFRLPVECSQSGLSLLTQWQKDHRHHPLPLRKSRPLRRFRSARQFRPLLDRSTVHLRNYSVDHVNIRHEREELMKRTKAGNRVGSMVSLRLRSSKGYERT